MGKPARIISKSRTKNGKIYLSLKGIITNWTRIFKISTKIVNKLISASSYLWPKQCKYQNLITKDSLKIRGNSKIRSMNIRSRRARGTEHRFFCSGMRKSLEFNQDTLTSNSTPNWASTASKTKYSLLMRLFTCSQTLSKRWWWWGQYYSRILTCCLTIQVSHTSMMFYLRKASSSLRSSFWAKPFLIFSSLILTQ